MIKTFCDLCEVHIEDGSECVWVIISQVHPSYLMLRGEMNDKAKQIMCCMKCVEAKGLK